MQQPTLETQRLLLRAFLLSDAPVVQRLANDYDVADTTLNLPHPYPDGLAENWIQTHSASFSEGAGIVFAIVLRATDELCGTISLDVDKHHAHAELGYWIGKWHWNQGYATEAASAMVAHGFTQLALHRVQARHFARNPASGRVMQKIGILYHEWLRKTSSQPDQ